MKWTNKGHEFDTVYQNIEKRINSIYSELVNMEKQFIRN